MTDHHKSSSIILKRLPCLKAPLSRRVTLLSLFLLTLFLPLDGRAGLLLTGRLNVNNASIEELTLLPYIGDVKAESIWEYRKRAGLFPTVESMINVEGIGAKTLEGIRPYIKLDGESDLSIARSESLPSPATASEEILESAVLLLDNERYYEQLLSSIREAEKGIVVSMFLFKTGNYSSNRANIILNALADAARRGLKVFVLLEESGSGMESVTIENKRSAERLAAAGATVLFDDPATTTHTKIVIIDRKRVFLGSHNFTHSALKYNNELSVRIDSSSFADHVLDYIEGLGR